MNNDKYSEKVSVNINTSTLSNIDLLVDNGYYSNRSDFINQALREGLQKHQSTLDRIIDEEKKTCEMSPKQWFVGVYGIDRQDMEAAKAEGKTITITGYGVLTIERDVDEELLFQVVQRIKLKGRAVCSESIKKHYGLK